jgi:putative nucleotidyltransferase with HDIG domain
LAEAAAESVGANAAMCRVCAYYHDIGKLSKPEYFIENQAEGVENPHNALTPTMSALIIIAHVKDGVDLAVKHKLNPRVIDIIQEHHGDSLVSFFHRRAQEQKKAEMEKVEKGLENPEDLPKIDEKNFRYPGPRPRTRESGIVSLADIVESASRSLKKPTPAKIRTMVEDLVNGRVCDGQLDECALSMRDLAKVKDSFCATLRSMLHTRIDYPKDDERSTLGRKSDLEKRQGNGSKTQPIKPVSAPPPADQPQQRAAS